MIKRLNGELKGLPANFVILALIPSKTFERTNLSLLKLLLKHGNGSYITINRPYKSLISLFRENKIDANKLHFIDCITEEIHEMEEGNCYFIDSPSDLTEIGIALEPIFKEGKHEFIFLDSLGTLLIYNELNTVIKFTHFLISKIRLHNLKGVFLGLHEDTDKTLIRELAKLCDKVIDLS